MDCKHICTTDTTPWHGDVFDHPDYDHKCAISGKIVHPCFRCTPDKCSNFEPATPIGGAIRNDP